MRFHSLKSIRKNIKEECGVKLGTNEIGIGLYIQIDWWNGSNFYFRKQLSDYDMLCDINMFVSNVVREAKQAYDNNANACGVMHQGGQR